MNVYRCLITLLSIYLIYTINFTTVQIYKVDIFLPTQQIISTHSVLSKANFSLFIH